jgi:hypothetical protein
MTNYSEWGNFAWGSDGFWGFDGTYAEMAGYDPLLSERDCDECGFTFKEKELAKRWDGAMVCKRCFEPEHERDVYRRRNR